MLRFYVITAVILLLSGNVYSQNASVDLFGDDNKINESASVKTDSVTDVKSDSKQTDYTSETKTDSDEQAAQESALFNFMGLKIPNFISSSAEDENSIEKLSQKAEDGDASAQLKLGYAYLYGLDGLTADYSKAFYYYELAAKQNDKIGINNLGTLYYNGIGTARNPHKAALLFAKAAEAGNFDAATNLGFIYVSGNGIEQNTEAGLTNFEKAAESGNVLAQFMTGCAYYYGKYRPLNFIKAAPYIKAAADQGFDEAQFLIANMYMNGQGYPQNYSNAVKYFKKAVEQGHLQAMMKLADIYSGGIKYITDIQQAHTLYNIAAVRGVQGAGEQREKIEAKMKVAQITNSQMEAENFHPALTTLTLYVRKTFGTNICRYVQ